jgi:hypothetical protein
VAEVARRSEVNPNLLHRWRRGFRQGAGNAFPGLGKRRWEEARVPQPEGNIGPERSGRSTLRTMLLATQNFPKVALENCPGGVGPKMNPELDAQTLVARFLRHSLNELTNGRTLYIVHPLEFASRGNFSRRN